MTRAVDCMPAASTDSKGRAKKCICMYMNMCTCVNVYMCTCVLVCMHMCSCVHVHCICDYVYIYITPLPPTWWWSLYVYVSYIALSGRPSRGKCGRGKVVQKVQTRPSLGKVSVSWRKKNEKKRDRKAQKERNKICTYENTDAAIPLILQTALELNGVLNSC